MRRNPHPGHFQSSPEASARCGDAHSSGAHLRRSPESPPVKPPSTLIDGIDRLAMEGERGRDEQSSLADRWSTPRRSWRRSQYRRTTSCTLATGQRCPGHSPASPIRSGSHGPAVATTCVRSRPDSAFGQHVSRMPWPPCPNSGAPTTSRGVSHLRWQSPIVLGQHVVELRHALRWQLWSRTGWRGGHRRPVWLRSHDVEDSRYRVLLRPARGNLHKRAAARDGVPRWMAETTRQVSRAWLRTIINFFRPLTSATR